MFRPRSSFSLARSLGKKFGARGLKFMSMNVIRDLFAMFPFPRNTVKSCSVGENGFGRSLAFGSARRRLFFLLCCKIEIYSFSLREVF